VLLLDDVLSELDEKRRAQLLQQIGRQTQTFITSTERDLPLPTGQVWQIERGTIKAV
jgi:recombinational DNA repair ATPase RecF